MQMKAFEDRKRNGKTSDIQVRDSVPVKQDLSSKASPPYEGEPLKVQHRKGTQVLAKRRDGSTTTRSTAHFKKVPYQTLDEVGRSQLEPGFGRSRAQKSGRRSFPNRRNDWRCCPLGRDYRIHRIEWSR